MQSPKLCRPGRTAPAAPPSYAAASIPFERDHGDHPGSIACYWNTSCLVLSLWLFLTLMHVREGRRGGRRRGVWRNLKRWGGECWLHGNGATQLTTCCTMCKNGLRIVAAFRAGFPVSYTQKQIMKIICFCLQELIKICIFRLGCKGYTGGHRSQGYTVCNLYSLA